MTVIKQIKDEIRNEFSAKRKALTIPEREEKSAKICDHAKNLVSFRHADIILLYYPIKSEINVLPIAEEAFKRGKAVAFPRCNTENHTMKFHIVSSFEDLELGAYKIMEPKVDCPVYDPESDTRVAVCYVPGLTFDSFGYRLGYGKGYYDKFMHLFRGSTIGVVFSDFTVSSLPKGRFDRHCDILLTEKGVKPIKIEKSIKRF